MNCPRISVIIPVFNEEKNIKKCLRSIRKQNYPQNKIEILIIDDYSTDNTILEAKKFGVKVFLNGSHNIERAKSIGLEKSISDFVIFIDADNSFISPNWIKQAYSIFIKHPNITGVESYRIHYKKTDGLVNRYCALFGINEPLVFYLGRRGYFMAGEKRWFHPKETLISEEKGYYLVKFNTNNLQTIGSNGYLTRKNLLLKTDWKPYLFHMDSAYDLVKLGYNEFGRIKLEVEHNYANSIINMLKKSKRNVDLFWKFRDIRRYKYNLGSLRSFIAVVICLTFIVPFIDSVRGYKKVRDLAWFLHPIISFITVINYIFSTLKNYFLAIT